MKKIILIILVTITSFTCYANEKKKPNVLFIAVDDMKPMVKVFGDKDIKSPNIDKLAKAGTVFLNNHCQQAVCAPSRVSLLTGMRPDTTQVWDLKTKMRDKVPNTLTLPQHFKNNGYTTVGMGKIFDPRSCDSRRQMDEISWSVPYLKVDGSRYVDGKDFQDRKPEDRLPVEMADLPDDKYADGKIANEALKQLDNLSKQNKPFFLAVGFKKPHLPFTAPKKYWDMYNRDEIKVNPVQKASEGAPVFAYQDSWELRNYGGVPEKGEPISEEQQKELIHGYRACVSFVDAQIGKVKIGRAHV